MLASSDHPEAHLEKDEDTDGISIISDSDPESTQCDIPCDKCLSSENNPSQSQDILCPLNDPQPPNKKTIESTCNEDDFLVDGSQKFKTYVHKRNKRLSMVLNIIMLGSVITAAGVAIGHMWGAKNECAAPTPSVNKILSNLYKLQEENAYLRSRLKELSLLGNIQKVQQLKSDDQKKPLKQNRCKKIFEEPLNVKVDRAFKCVDEDVTESAKPLDPPELLTYEKEFLNDIGKLKKVYNQNKSWLDEHIQRRLNNENNIVRNKQHNNTKDGAGKDQISFQGQAGLTLELPKVEEHVESTYTPDKDFRIPESDKGTKSHKAWNIRKQTGNKVENFEKNKEKVKREIKLPDTKKSHRIVNLERQISQNIGETESFENIKLNIEDISNEASQTKEKKISYADSLRTNSNSQKVHSQINDTNDLPTRGMRGYGHKRNHGDADNLLNLISSDDEIKKDDRYAGPKMKRDKKKHDRHKIHKKQKRKNKYEQWEMKGGYMKDFDEFSMTSSQVNLENNVITPEKKYMNHDFENYLTKLTEADQSKKPKKREDNYKPENKGKKGKNKEPEWYDKRYNMRADARRKLEQELFGESSMNNAAWYFRRMNKREQCRAQKDNSTFKKFSKQKMNFKMKH